jgi:Domain of unknown function (DUF4149)
MDAPPRPLSLVVEVVALSFWLGAAVLFAAVVAPALFAALPSRTTAGDVVGRVLPVLLWAGIVVSLIAGFIEAVAQNAILTRNWNLRGQPPDLNDVVHFAGYRVAGQRAGLGFVIALACGYALVLGQRIDRLRVSVGQPIETLSASDPRRLDFGRMHAWSVAALGVAMLSAAGLTVSAVRRLLGQRAAQRTFQQRLEPSHHA